MNADQRELFDAALRAYGNAHAPYSNFPVGAAVRSSSGRVYAGCNVENAAYPQGWCAEASAIAAMVTAGEREIVAVLVLAGGAEVITCCGGCRQKLVEFAGRDVPVWSCDLGGIRAEHTLGTLLPNAFGRGWAR
ncbi:MAG: cytidine deaminase Cdd [Actinomycetota bacterium]